MATRGKSARDKGNQYERKIVIECKQLGFEKALTSRNESKTKDDAKVDLCFTDPFNIQCKAVEKLGSYFDILDSMPEDENYNVIFHKKNFKGEIVVLRQEDFYEIIKMLKTEKII